MKNMMSAVSEGSDSWFDRFRTKRSRRSLTGFYLAVLALMLLVTWLVDSYWPVLPLGILYAGLTILLVMSIRGITGQATDQLDEQQVAVRNAGYKTSYWLGVGVAFGGGMLISGIHETDTAFEAGLFLAVWGFVSGLPMMVVAWTLPTEVDDEE